MIKKKWMGIVLGVLMVNSVKAQIGQLEWGQPLLLPSIAKGKPHIGIAGPIAGVAAEYLLIGGGANFPDLAPWEGGAKRIQKQIFVYKKEQDKLVFVAQDDLDEGVAYGASLHLPNGLLVIGGEDSKGRTVTCRLLNVETDSKKIIETPFPELPVALSNMAAVRVEDRLFVAGGESKDGVSDLVLQLDLHDLAKGWVTVGHLPYAVSHSQLLADKDQVLYLVGGRKAHSDSPSALYNELWCSTDLGISWPKKADIPFAAAAGTACILPDQGLWLLSADRGTTFHQVETLIFDAQKEPDPSKKQQLIATKNQLQINHPGFGREIWRYDLSSKHWEKAGELPMNAPVTTTAVLWDDMIILPSGEIRAGIRSPHILLATFKAE
ncbi:hypothetical protein ACR79N_05655 [Sphingobacterium siyangense]|uniref:hypothetical protein n=1 Tax=Sphingobacterium TaxID=28453 RepID=UPI000E9D4E68|nr:hypothetical protein [Sphingobacterium multivorum]HAU54241.1 hypothetical protein [Sphingobacterium sp.]HCX56514.1 hypothetical protein [Sphingobacterium sp.]